MNSAAGTTSFYIIRHGETVWNQKSLLQGHMDSPLTELGIRQAKAVASVLYDKKFDLIVSSDLGRAVHTTDIINESLKLPVFKDARLRERNMGVAQGLTIEEFASKYGNDYENFMKGDPDFIIQGGESIRQRFERSVNCFSDMAKLHAGKRIIVVTHGGVLDGIFRKTVGLSLDRERKFSIYNASINTITIRKDGWYLENWGFISHLERLGTMEDWYKGAI